MHVVLERFLDCTVYICGFPAFVMGLNSSQKNRLIEAKYLHLFLKSNNRPFNGAFSARLLLFTELVAL